MRPRCSSNYEEEQRELRRLEIDENGRHRKVMICFKKDV